MSISIDMPLLSVVLGLAVLVYLFIDKSLLDVLRSSKLFLFLFVILYLIALAIPWLIIYMLGTDNNYYSNITVILATIALGVVIRVFYNEKKLKESGWVIKKN